MIDQHSNILIGIAETQLRETLVTYLRQECGYYVETALTPAEMLERIESARGRYGVVIVDDALMLRLDSEPTSSGIQLITEGRAYDPAPAFILLTDGYGRLRLEALRAGAYHYLRKPFALEELSVLIERAIEYRQLKEELRSIRVAEQQIRSMYILEPIHKAGLAVTSSLTLQEILNLIVEQASLLIGRKEGLQCISHLVLVEEDILRFTAAYPPETLKGLTEKLGDVNLRHDKKVGIIGRAVKEGKSQIVDNVRNDPDYRESDANINSELAVPIFVDRQVIGAINMEHTEHASFGEREQQALEVFAGYAAIAIKNARLYAESQQLYIQSQAQRQRLEAIAEISRQAVASRDIDQLLRTVCWRLEKDVPKEVISCIRLYDSKTKVLYFQSEWHEFPSDIIVDWKKGITIYSLNDGIGGWVGINKSPFKSGNVHALKGVPKYIQRSFEGPNIQSELCVPILSEENRELIGVLDMMSLLPNAFDDDDEKLMVTLAAQLAVAIQNARRYQDLLDINGYVGAYTAVDWMKMISATWGHNINREVSTALGLVALLRGTLEATTVPPIVHQDLERLEQELNTIKSIPIIVPLSSEDTVTTIPINELVQTYLERQWQHLDYQAVQLHLDLEATLDARVQVRASREWLRQALKILVDNAVQAMLDSDRPTRQLTVRTWLADEQVEIAIRDTGPGLPREVVEKGFDTPIIKPEGSRGAGIGLIIAKTIVRAYRGTMRVATTDHTGTEIVLAFPVENQPADV
jgi:GAF domain-containing protein/FixJ family two-component response regulator/anti-sigma regulatory factor (Ser/Thr protein kinase)